jgi:hypothetical protein
MFQFLTDFTIQQWFCEALTMTYSNTGCTELMLHNPGTMNIIERAPPKAGATLRHKGIGLEAFTNFSRRNLIPGLIAHDGAWPQHIIIGNIGQ